MRMVLQKSVLFQTVATILNWAQAIAAPEVAVLAKAGLLRDCVYSIALTPDLIPRLLQDLVENAVLWPHCKPAGFERDRISFIGGLASKMDVAVLDSPQVQVEDGLADDRAAAGPAATDQAAEREQGAADVDVKIGALSPV
ncbi:hypothetical protein AMAG_06454 [Allomyces macrogynus ATCC 38327]|uniref:Uncharacterized protein n=1 Tax=Allomyces macrogynus (strain ATCC 38327) TaxID=578462 RepID=A0A0L0SH03_ALLM3|nr:hypothetical protein AMAG_06454 [Allomyces macrogynus ATCC 38327]|eukprot:KNE61645.1 hypothetical protein AMAG_06454 [Allomyces macrogynus ATCC 38327]